MKLYTENQVIEMIEKSRKTGLTAEYLILSTTPIELPTNEETKEEILQFLYSEITERRDYSASKMCEVIIEFIEKLKIGGK